MDAVQEYCFNEYKDTLDYGLANLPIRDDKNRRVAAQKIAIKQACISAIEQFPDVEPSVIWKAIYTAHVNLFSNISDPTVIMKVISADQSWKKSSGHAFEEMISDLSNPFLAEYGIRIMLQRELNILLHEERVLNLPPDISWLKEQVKKSVFDLYLTIEEDGNFWVYGCVQSKTSIRDRVTRDREPSLIAMKSFFMSVAVVLDGDFLKPGKFQDMVNGGPGFDLNGWHAMYVLTNEPKEIGRIHGIDLSMDVFVKDAVEGAKQWQTQRQWLDNKWAPPRP